MYDEVRWRFSNFLCEFIKAVKAPLIIVLLRSTCISVLYISTISCAPQVQHNPVPAQLVDEALIPDFTAVRTWADEISPEFVADIKERHQQIAAAGLSGRTMQFLTLSGGGENGAFGAGVLTAPMTNSSSFSHRFRERMFIVLFPSDYSLVRRSRATSRWPTSSRAWLMSRLWPELRISIAKVVVYSSSRRI
jgi:hypothetical protein